MSNTDVVHILKGELTRRCQLNHRYSLRAFARTLGVSPANLSLVLNRKRAPSKKTIERMLTRLPLEPIQREWISQSQSSVQPDLVENTEFEVIETVSTWLSFAILSLLKTKDFRSDFRWVATRLSVSVHEVKTSVEALRAAGFLEISKKGWKRSPNGIRLKNLVPTAVSQNFQRQLITKALDSMENDPVEIRDLTSVTFAMSAQKMEIAKTEIRKFRLKMAELFEDEGKATDVYNLTVQLAPATKNK